MSGIQTYGEYRRSKSGEAARHFKKRPRIAPPREEMYEKRPRLESEGESDNRGFRPSMLSFKSFLQTQDDSITDDEALTKYTEYKHEFNRQQLNEFFVAHKEEEWFRFKYHPTLRTLRQEESSKNIKQRLTVFMDLYERGFMKELRLDHECEAQISTLLDCFVLGLEGGSEENIAKLSKNEKLDVEQHKTASIHLRSIHPAVKREEIESVCRKYPGYLRLSLSEPQPERNWLRKGWASFSRDTKIKEICFSLSSVRFKDVELSPVINKDLSQRIRTVLAIANDKSQMRSDLMAVSNLVTLLDKQWNLWDKKADDPADILPASTNPLLENITEFMIEEMSAEEDELLGYSSNSSSADHKAVERDTELANVLDRLIIYLRLVHSIDFYNAAHYQAEHEMPNRCGIFHVRADCSQFSTNESDLSQYKEDFSKKIKKLSKSWDTVPDEDTPNLGLKDETEAVEIFVQANTEELGNDKYLCPLSGKKFKGVEFVRKHIFNKHAERVDEVKKDVQFFNHYIKDPRRPSLPEKPKQPAGKRAPASRPAQPSDVATSSGRRFEDRPVKPSVKDRLGYKKMPPGPADPRGLVDYTDVDFADDMFS